MTSTPEQYDVKQNDFVKSPQQNNENERRTPRERDRCLFCCTPKVLMIISVIYFILGVLHAVTRGIYLSQCHDLYNNLDSTIPSNLSYNPSTTPTLNINSWESIGIYFNNRYNELQIYQTNDASVTDVNIQIRSNSKKFETATTSSSYNIHLAGDGLGAFFSLWSFKCTVNRVDVILPQQIVSTTSSPVNINSQGLDITFKQNSVPYPYPINLKTTSGDVNLENVLATSASIQLTSGDVKGSISSLQNGLDVELTSGDINIKASTSNSTSFGSPTFGLRSTSGNIDLELVVPNVVVKPVVDISATSGDVNTGITLANGITDSQITLKTTSGDIDVNLHDSFQGQYQITTTSGDVNVEIENNKNHNRKGIVGTGGSQGFLQIGATSGDVNVQF